MMRAKTDIELVRESFRRCDEELGFFDSFYDRFLSASPAVAQKFAHTDMDHQALMLRASVELLLAKADQQESLAHLKTIAAIHGHQGAAVEPALYSNWLEALIDTVRAYDARFDTEIERAWRDFMRSRIEFILANY